MEIVPLSSVRLSDWEDFVNDCDECWLYHHPVFLEMEDPQSMSFAVLDQGRVSGGCVLHLAHSGIGNVLSGGFGPDGLAFLPGVARRAYPLVREYLVERARRCGCHAVQMNLPILAPAYRNVEYLDTHLYRLGFTNTLRWGTSTHYTPSYTTIIELGLSLDDIFRQFSSSVRQKCQRASGISFSHEFLQQDATSLAWEAFLSNHDATMRRGGAQSLPAPLLMKMRQLLVKGFAALINFKADDRIFASLLLLTYKQSAFYFSSGVQSDAYDDGFSAQLHWIAVQELKRRGYERYEVGQFYPLLRGTKLHRLGEFKRMFGGNKRPVLAGELVTHELRFVGLDLGPAYGRKFLKGIYDSMRKFK